MKIKFIHKGGAIFITCFECNNNNDYDMLYELTNCNCYDENHDNSIIVHH